MKKRPVSATTYSGIQITEALRKPEERRWDREITDLNRLNGELTQKANPMGFVYAGTAFAPSEFAQAAGKNYTRSGIPWPQLHMSLWDRAAALVADQQDSINRLAQVRQYVGVILAAPELDEYGKRNCLPDYIAKLIDQTKDVPRTHDLEEYLQGHPRLHKHFKMVEQTMAVLAAGQLIY
ncbi:hypothetical protein [Xanthomonas virus PB119]|nr:hypothetical protein [Xanthomonas virus PB119]